MDRTLGFIISAAVLLVTLNTCEGLECYHCFSGSQAVERDGSIPPCNEKDLSASNTLVTLNEKLKCIYATVELPYTKLRQVWRTVSKEGFEPCDPKSFPEGVKMIGCSFCGTDKCNLYGKENEKNSFTFNINANVNLFIKQ